MQVAVAWNGSTGRKVMDRGPTNQETMPRGHAQGVVDALREVGHDAALVAGDMDLLARLEETLDPEGLVFNTCYGVQGRARYTHVPAMLESAGWKYTGSDPLAHAVCLEKPLAKTVLAAHGVPTLPWVLVPVPEGGKKVDGRPRPRRRPWAFRPARRDADGGPCMGFPAVVKPVREGGSMGLRLVEDRASLHDAVAHVHERFDQAAMIEPFVAGTDLMVPLIGNQDVRAMAVVQVHASKKDGGILTQRAKEAGDSQVRSPAPLGRSVTRRIKAVARRAYRTLGLADWGRIDIRMAPDGRFWVLEVNSIPGLGPHSSFRVAADAHWLGFSGHLDAIVQAADERWRNASPAIAGGRPSQVSRTPPPRTHASPEGARR